MCKYLNLVNKMYIITVNILCKLFLQKMSTAMDRHRAAVPMLIGSSPKRQLTSVGNFAAQAQVLKGRSIGDKDKGDCLLATSWKNIHLLFLANALFSPLRKPRHSGKLLWILAVHGLYL